MQKEAKHKESLSWFKLAALGMGFTTGTGFFLGSSLAIEKSGFSVLMNFLIAAVGTYFVFSALADLIAQDPDAASFRIYSKKAFGRWAGFSHGWMYWSAEMLIVGSQLTAMALFTKYWFVNTPLWLLATIFAVMGIGVLLLGTKGFEKAENMFAAVKIAAILMFIILACLVFPGALGKDNAHMHLPNKDEIFVHGPMGLWTSLIYVFFAFAGIEVMGLMATRLNHPNDARKAGKVMLSVTTVLYIVSIGLALLLAPFTLFSKEESPFVTALLDLKFTFLIHIFNGVLIIAGFSSLVASLFSVTLMMYTIAKDGDAPKLFGKMSKRHIPYGSIGLTVLGMTVSIVAGLLLPKEVYEYITTAGGLMLIYAWLFMIFASRKLLKLPAWGQIKTIAAVVIIGIAATGTLFDPASRTGFFASLGCVVIIGGITMYMHKRWSRTRSNEYHFYRLESEIKTEANKGKAGNT